jgi:hypothetical protein
MVSFCLYIYLLRNKDFSSGVPRAIWIFQTLAALPDADMFWTYQSARLEFVLLLDSDKLMRWENPDSESWLEAMESELKFIVKNQVRNLFSFLMVLKPSSANVCVKRNLSSMKMFLCVELGLSRMGSHKFKALTTARPSRQ